MRKVFCATLGCDKNLVDSEALLGRFAIRGVQPVDDPDAADIWVLNSCGFIDAARSDSETTLRELCEAKEGRTLVVCGCWSQEHSARIRADFPAVDVVAGVGQFDQVVAACLGSAPAPAAAAPAASPFALAGPAVAPDALVVDPMVAPYQGLVDRPLLTPPHVAFVKIGEGCNCACTFCRIPLIRGKQRSRSRAELLAEVRGLVERGVSEIQLVSQNTSDYGRDTGEKLYDLVRDLDGVDGLRTIRLLYLYSGMVSVDDLRRLLDLPAVAPYLDLPIQHASPRILKAMKRPGGEKSSARFFRALRDGRPDLVLRSTALLGFPGEEDEDVAELADFLAEVRFDHLGTHHYSAESGTPSAGLPDRVPAEVILDREALITDLQEDISLARQEERLGQVHEVVIDAVVRPGPDDPHGLAEVLGSLAEGTWRDDRERERFDGVAQSAVSFAVGRSYHFGYDLDGVVVLPLGEAGVGSRLRPGETVRAEFGGVTAYDVWARPVADPGR
ncbi:radical SAM protein [bacterium]|nr:radical SAM protein [bacterium]